jgi:zona occludens toxin
MSITLLVGAPGHGKSITLAREFHKALRSGKPVVTNLPIRPDWALVMARGLVPFGRWRKEAVARRAMDLERYVYRTENMEDLLRVRVEGKGESRALIILDEAHRNLNPRTADNGLDENGEPVKKAHAVARRMKIIQHLSGHRHYGFDVILASQDAANLDIQVKRLYEFISEVRNFRRLPMFGAIFRFNLFLRVTRWNDRSRTKAGIDVYLLNRRVASLYDTHALEGIDWPENPILLPSPIRPDATINGSNDVDLNHVDQDAGSNGTQNSELVYDGYDPSD